MSIASLDYDNDNTIIKRRINSEIITQQYYTVKNGQTRHLDDAQTVRNLDVFLIYFHKQLRRIALVYQECRQHEWFDLSVAAVAAALRRTSSQLDGNSKRVNSVLGVVWVYIESFAGINLNRFGYELFKLADESL